MLYLVVLALIYAGSVFLFSYGYELYDVPQALRLTALLVFLSVAAVIIIAILGRSKSDSSDDSSSSSGGDRVIWHSWDLDLSTSAAASPVSTPARPPSQPVICSHCGGFYVPAGTGAPCPHCGTPTKLTAES